MSSFNSLKQFLGYFIIYAMRVDCNGDQAVGFLLEGSHYHLQYQDMKHYKGWRLFFPSEKTFNLAIGTTGGISGSLSPPGAVSM